MRQDAVISVAERSHVPELLSLLEALFNQEQDFTPNAQKQVLGLLQIIDHPETGRIFIARYNNAVVGMATTPAPSARRRAGRSFCWRT